jgi:integrase
LTPISVQTLIEHYREKELGPNCSKTRKTQVTYEGYFNKWILPRWGSYRVTEVKAVAVEQWLRSLKYANGSKAKARNIMSAVFNHAVRWEWLAVNPIRMVRQSAKRTRMPIVLSIEQIAALLRILKEPTRTMVFLAAFTGLRAGELLGLKWKDVDFQKMEIHVIRSIVMQHVGDCKTEASHKPVPLDLRLAKVLWSWRLQSHTRLMRTGYSLAHTAGANCRTGQVRFTRRTWSRRQRKSESWATSVGIHSGTRTRRSSRGTART